MAVKSYSLTTAARTSAYMSITTPTGDTLAAFEAVIDTVTTFIENYIGFRVMKTTYTQEECDTERADTLNLNHFPVVAGETFTLERRTSAQNNDDWETVDSQYYHVDNDSGILEGASGLRFSRTTKGYRVTYTAGFDYDNTATFLSDTDAGDIELAAWMLTEAIWNKRKGGAGVVSEKIGDYSVTYKKTLMENEDVKAILDKYTSYDALGTLTSLQA